MSKSQPIRTNTTPHCGVAPETLKRSVYAYCSGKNEEETPIFDEGQIITECIPAWQAFKKYDFDLDLFMSECGYKQIEDEEMCLEILMGACLPLIKQPLSQYMTDWINGYLDFFKLAPDIDIEWKKYSKTELLHCLFNCETDYDIWNFLAEGIGDMPALYKWYKGLEISPILEAATGIPCYSEKDEKKAEELLDYLLTPSTQTVESVRKQAETLKHLFKS